MDIQELRIKIENLREDWKNEKDPVMKEIIRKRGVMLKIALAKKQPQPPLYYT
jgi:hypothetical protein